MLTINNLPCISVIKPDGLALNFQGFLGSCVPRCPCGLYTVGVAATRGHVCTKEK